MLFLDSNCSYTNESTSFELACNVSYRGYWKPDITCLPDSSDQVSSIQDSQPGVVMYRKRVNMTSDITSFVITCQASFSIIDSENTTDGVLDVTNHVPSSVFLWNSSEISFPCK